MIDLKKLSVDDVCKLESNVATLINNGGTVSEISSAMDVSTTFIKKVAYKLNHKSTNYLCEKHKNLNCFTAKTKNNLLSNSIMTKDEAVNAIKSNKTKNLYPLSIEEVIEKLEVKLPVKSKDNKTIKKYINYLECRGYKVSKIE